MIRRVVYVALLLGGVAFASEISTQDLLDGLKNPERWLTYSGDYSGRRHSPLEQLTRENVAGLKPAWIFQTGLTANLEATPLVIDGFIYFTGPYNHGWALDARTGREVWHRVENLPSTLSLCCGWVNRGFAVFQERLYVARLDATLLAMDMKTGEPIGGIVLDDHELGYSATSAPLVVKDKVVVGIAGSINGTRGFIDAYDVNTGRLAWRFWTVPEPGEPGGDTWSGDSWKQGGASPWLTGTYDPELNLIYWGTGNPAPMFYGDEREGDNLYSNSIVALDADTGELEWYYQFTPHDTRDWDSAQIPVLADLPFDGSERKLLLTANRNGFFYVLDRTNGELLLAKPFVNTTWAKEIGDDGRPVELPDARPTEQGTLICPDVEGATNWMSPSFSPDTGLFYVTAREGCATYFSWKESFAPGQPYFGGGTTRSRTAVSGMLRAIDPATARVEWEFPYAAPSTAGTLSTAGGLVFGGGDGNLIAFDALTGEDLWHFQTGGPITAAPITYLLDGKQYVAVASRGALIAFSLPD